jgi:O-antigen/teichoic acid export membrane protein
VAWATGFQLFRDVVQFGLTMVLARMLPPDVYGQFAFLTTLLGFFTLYSFREFLGHTLQVRDHEAVAYQDHFTAGAVIQIGLAIAVNAVAIGLRWLPDYAATSGVLHVMSVLFLLDLPAEMRVKMLERELNWRRLRSLQAVGFISGAGVSIVLAWSGAGVYALLLPTLLVPLPFVFDLFVTSGWRPTWAFSWDRYRPSWRFGWTRIATVSFVAAATLVESAWLAAAFGFAVLGLFGRAVALAQLVCGRIAGLLALSIYPVLTRLPVESEQFRRAGALYLRSVGWTVVPLASVTAILAGPIVLGVYGPAWIEAIALVPFAVAAAALMGLVQTAYTLLLANGQQRACLVTDVWRLAGTLIALAVALPYGAKAYLAATSAMYLVSFGLVAGFLWQGRAVTLRAVSLAVGPALVAAGAAVGAARLAGGVHVVVTALAFALIYLAVLRSLFATPLQELIRYLPLSERLSRWLRFNPAPASTAAHLIP